MMDVIYPFSGCTGWVWMLVSSQSRLTPPFIGRASPPIVFCVHGNKWGMAQCCQTLSEEEDALATHCHQVNKHSHLNILGPTFEDSYLGTYMREKTIFIRFAIIYLTKYGEKNYAPIWLHYCLII